MCLSLPKCIPTPKSPGELVENLAKQLRLLGMKDVTPRATARIPIVLFQDPRSGLDCDISFENPLALRNTQLLRVSWITVAFRRQILGVILHTLP